MLSEFDISCNKCGVFWMVMGRRSMGDMETAKTNEQQEERDKKDSKKKVKSKDNNKSDKSLKNKNYSVFKWFHFFSIYSVIGIILILLSIILELLDKEWIALDILIKFLDTVGIALLIGSIFDFSKNSQSFLDFVSSLLYEIVVSKEFLKKLGRDDKKQALELILRPSSEQLEKCANIDDYFKKGIDSSMEMFESDFKTNLVIHAQARMKDGKVVVSGVMTNRVYKLKDKFSPIYTTFERDDCSIVKTTIIHPEGEDNETLVESMLTDEQIGEKGQIAVKYELKIPPELQHYPYLTIRREFLEPGFNHWTNFHWTSLTPCDGIVFHLKCDDNLIIKDYLIFDDKKLYDVTLSDDKTDINIISINWLNRFTGFTLTISDKNS